MDICETEIVYNATPPSFNEIGTRASHWKVNRAKKEWQGALWGLLMASDMPRGRPGSPSLVCVNASARLRFPQRRGRDINNFVVILDKALGDALTKGHWIADDTPEFYTFAGLSFEPDPGPNRTTVVLAYERRAYEPLGDGLLT
jgi:hypothetical protein